MVLIRNIPFIVVQVVVACCLIADVFVLKSPRYVFSAVPIEILALFFLICANFRKRSADEREGGG